MSEWISVEKELPPLENGNYSVDVLACFKKKMTVAYIEWYAHLFYDESYSDIFKDFPKAMKEGLGCWIFFDEDFGEPTHWMPLPKPPEYP